MRPFIGQIALIEAIGDAQTDRQDAGLCFLMGDLELFHAGAVALGCSRSAFDGCLGEDREKLLAPVQDLSIADASF
jgi:hypothetical protein